MNEKQRKSHYKKAEEFGLDPLAYVTLLEVFEEEGLDPKEDEELVGELYEFLRTFTSGIAPERIYDIKMNVILQIISLEPEEVKACARPYTLQQIYDIEDLVYDLEYTRGLLHYGSDQFGKTIMNTVKKYPDQKSLASDQQAFRSLLVAYDKLEMFRFLDSCVWRYQLLLMDVLHSTACEVEADRGSRSSKLIRLVNETIDELLDRPLLGEKQKGFVNLKQVIEDTYSFSLPDPADKNWDVLYPEEDEPCEE